VAAEIPQRWPRETTEGTEKSEGYCRAAEDAEKTGEKIFVRSTVRLSQNRDTATIAI